MDANEAQPRTGTNKLTTVAIEKKLNLILAKVLLKFELVIQKNLLKLEQQSISTPPFLAEICLEERVPPPAKEEQGPQTKYEHAPTAQDQPDQKQSRNPSTTYTQSPQLAQPPAQPSKSPIDILHQEPIDNQPAATHQEQEQEQEQQPNTETAVDPESPPPVSLERPLPPKPLKHKPPVLKDVDQNNPSGSNQPLLKRLKEDDTMVRRRGPKKKRKQQANKRGPPEQLFPPIHEQGYPDENGQARTPDPIDMRIGELITWGQTMPAGYYPPHFQPQYQPPSGPLHGFAEQPQPYLTRPNGYSRYAIPPPSMPQYPSYSSEEYWSYLAPQPMPNLPHNPIAGFHDHHPALPLHPSVPPAPSAPFDHLDQPPFDWHA